MNTDKTFYEVAMAEADSFVAAGCFATAERPAMSDADAKRLAEAWTAPAFYDAATAEAGLAATERDEPHGDRARFEAALGKLTNGKPEEHGRLQSGVHPETQ